VSLRTLKENTATFGGKIASIYRAIRSGSPQGKIEMLSRLQLDKPTNIKERLLQRLVASVLPD
jgi:hypothetical protein